MSAISQSAIEMAIDEFIDLMRTPQPPDLQPLMRGLDRLILLAHDVEFDFDETEYPDPVTDNPQDTYRLANRWLESLMRGYPDDDTTPIDAIMDLSEIIDDFLGIQWRFRHTSKADALFEFQLGFQSHWGHHARSLLKTLHAWYW